MTNAPPLPWWSLQKAVRQAGLNYTKLAELAGISRQYVGYLASGERRPTVEIITLLAGALEISPDELGEGVCLTTSPEEMLAEIDGLVEVLDKRIESATTAIEQIKAKRAYLQQLVQVPA